MLQLELAGVAYEEKTCQVSKAMRLKRWMLTR